MLVENQRIQLHREKYRAQGDWGDATLADFWKMAVLCTPEKKAVIDDQGASYTYQELDKASNSLAVYFRECGVATGDIVSFQIPGWAEFTMIYIACLKSGAVANPILPCLRAKDVGYILRKCETKLYFCPTVYRKFDYTGMLEELLPQLPDLKHVVVVEKTEESKDTRFIRLSSIIKKAAVWNASSAMNADALAAVLFTSGTESFPKGVMLTHNNIISSERAFTAALNITYRDKILMPSPTAHAMGFHHGVTAAFMTGATSVLLDRFKAEAALSLIERERCTCTMGPSPFVYDLVQSLQEQKRDISSLRFFLCGGAPIPRHMFQEALAVGIRMLGVYGATESVPHVVHALTDPAEKIFSTDGRPLPGIEIKIVDENRKPVEGLVQGEEASRGPNVFAGYLKEPELTAHVFDEDGWYYSGDFCVMDADGYLNVTGRKKDIIIRGGENVSSVEIEHILLKHENVKDAAIIGMPDLRLGERICAYVVLKDKEKTITIEDVKDFFARHKAAKCKWPEHLEFVDDLPRTASGKIQKYILREDIRKKISQIENAK